MLFTTTDALPGYVVRSVLGVVTGNVVQSKHVGRDIMAGLKGIVGGELKGYTEMMSEARNKAIQRLVDEASKLGADAVVGIRFSTSSILAGSCELLAYGTAVKLQRA
ncbi:heavy metal-binding domain-containing protein [Alkalimonas delamerensis]|uniref:UPF0145 protein Q3O59_08505 n=1 Tax=Alkalimonas delamerensis TaxID=265981 RepID=A0ABT9GQ17_9GAMM|nr:heavy metal-binding domain-containing protein [Alkalimonas delamerensis]MDP4529070.1 heavy metal-binding domain-containing protein [Alkalimonas delamerensis]